MHELGCKAALLDRFNAITAASGPSAQWQPPSSQQPAMLLSGPELALVLRQLTQSPPHATLADVSSSCLEPFDRNDHFRVLCAVLLQLEVC